MVCRFFPIKISASKHRDSTESSIVLRAVNLLLPSWCFHPEQIWAGGGPQECGPFAIRQPRSFAHATIRRGFWQSPTTSPSAICAHQIVALNIVRRPKATPVHELERYMRCKDCSRLQGRPYKRSHLVTLRPTKISASDSASTWWPGER